MPVRALRIRVALLAAWLGLCLFFLAPAYSAGAANLKHDCRAILDAVADCIAGGLRAATSVEEIASAKKAAGAALEIVQDTLRDTAFVGPRIPGSAPRSGPHWGMYDLLQSLNRAARAVSDDDGKNPASMKQKEASILQCAPKGDQQCGRHRESSRRKRRDKGKVPYSCNKVEQHRLFGCDARCGSIGRPAAATGADARAGGATSGLLAQPDLLDPLDQQGQVARRVRRVLRGLLGNRLWRFRAFLISASKQ